MSHVSRAGEDVSPEAREIYTPARQLLIVQGWTAIVYIALLAWLSSKPFATVWVALPTIMLVPMLALTMYGIVRLSSERIEISAEGVTDRWLCGGWRVARAEIRSCVDDAVGLPFSWWAIRDFYEIETRQGKRFRIDRIFQRDDRLRESLQRIVRENTSYA